MAGGGDIDWDDVRVFLAIAGTGSIVAAAAALGIDETTVGRRLKKLEAEIGARLFERLPNRLVPTALGEDLAAAGAGMREGAAAFARRLDAATRGGGLVRVSATGSVSLFLAGHLQELLAAASGIGVEIATTRAASDLGQREADIALRMRRVPADGQLVTRRVGRIAFAVYVARRLWDERGRGWNGMAVVGLAATRRAASQSGWLDRFARAEGAAVRVRLGEVALRHRAVRDGMGASLLPCFLGDADADLVRLCPPPPELAEDIHLLIHEDTRATAAVRAVADGLAACLRRHAGALDGSSVDRQGKATGADEAARRPEAGT